MAMGRRDTERQQDLFVPTAQLPRSIGHVFYSKLNELLAEAGFDAWVENLCQQYYAKGKGRPGIPPGVYFRMLLVGYFEGIQSQRGIAWRCADSASLKSFLGLSIHETTPDYSSLTPHGQKTRSTSILLRNRPSVARISRDFRRDSTRTRFS